MRRRGATIPTSGNHPCEGVNDSNSSEKTGRVLKPPSFSASYDITIGSRSTARSPRYPTVLARYAVAQIHDGRKVGGKLNVRDVSSNYAQRRKGFHVERLDQFDDEENQWQEILVEDRNAGPADVATTKIDFTEWLKSFPARLRRITKLLATGEKTNIVAETVRSFSGKNQPVEKRAGQAWKKFQGEEPDRTVAEAHHEESYCPAA